MTFLALLNRCLAKVNRQLVKTRSPIILGDDWVLDVRRYLGVRAGGVILDVGANCGQTTKRLARAFPDLAIHCLEPNQDLHARIKERVNFHKNLQVHRCGAGAEDTEMPFFKSTKHESNSFHQDWSHRHGVPTGTETVPVHRLDTFCAQNGMDTVSVLKINAEGFDFKVLEGAAGMLKKKKILSIYVEVSFGAEADESGRCGDYLNHMEAQGYHFVGLYQVARAKEGYIKWGNLLFTA
jgi:FkbM family methyltransferase